MTRYRTVTQPSPSALVDGIGAVDQARSFLEGFFGDWHDGHAAHVALLEALEDVQHVLVTLARDVDAAEDLNREALERAVLALLPAGATVDVDDWSGYELEEDDEEWVDPVYITGTAPDGTEYVDAICDAGAATIEEQAAYVVDQLVNG